VALSLARPFGRRRETEDRLRLAGGLELRRLSTALPGSPDGLWYALAASFVLPVLVYVVSVAQAQRSM